MAELFTEGSCPFDFAQLLQYRNDEYDPSKVLEKIEDSNIKVRKFLKSSAGNLFMDKFLFVVQLDI